MRRSTPILLTAATAGFLFLGGCTVDRNDKVTNVGVPAGSEQIDQGSGRMNFTADHNGEVYIYDATADRLVYERPIAKGDQLLVDPETNRVELNDSSTGNHHLDASHTYRIYVNDRSRTGTGTGY